jgi:hypothetical protein
MKDIETPRFGGTEFAWAQTSAEPATLNPTARKRRPRAALGSALVLLLLASSLAGMARSTSADSVLEQSVAFGLPRTQVVYGFDFEASCHVSVSYKSLDMLDGHMGYSFFATSPGACAITAYVLGVPVSLPVADMTPLGRLHFSIPGVSGFTFGLADITFDLGIGLRAALRAQPAVATVTPSSVEWTEWGTAPLAVQAHAGGQGDTLSITFPYMLSMTFSVGVSVFAFGFKILSVDFFQLGVVTGTPEVALPVSIDLRPTQVSIIGAGADAPDLIHINWAENLDMDFASYRLMVADNLTTFIVVIESRSQTHLILPALPGHVYQITVNVLDIRGQSSVGTYQRVTTPPEPMSPAPEKNTPLSANPILIFLSGISVGGTLAWFLASRRRKHLDTENDRDPRTED